MILVQTGNKCDIVYGYEDGVQVLHGIQPHGGDLIPIPDPIAFARTLLKIAEECGFSLLEEK